MYFKILAIKKLLILIFGLIGILILTIIYLNIDSGQKKQVLGVSSGFTQPVYNFDDDFFYKGINQSKEQKKPIPTTTYGAIIPHHTVAGFMMANYFSQLALQKPKTIILIGPNHY